MAEYQIWCESCMAFVDEFEEKEVVINIIGELEKEENISWLCCEECGEGLVKVIH